MIPLLLGRLLRLLCVACLGCSLAACGGDDSGAFSVLLTPPAADAGSDRTVLVGAQVILDGRASVASSARGLSFSWMLSQRPAASVASLAAADGALARLQADVPGVYVATLAVNDGLSTSAPVSVRIEALPTDTLRIGALTLDPATRTLRLFLSGPVPGASVQWFVDGNSVGSGASMDWSAAAVMGIGIGVSARIEVSPGGPVVEIARQLKLVDAMPFQLAAAASGTTGTITVDAHAISPFGIDDVTATLDGLPLVYTSAYINCPSPTPLVCSSFAWIHRFAFDAAAIGSGAHVLLITATDAAGDTRQLSLPMPVSNPPRLVLASPADGGMVQGTMTLSGRASSDKSGPVAIAGSLGGIALPPMTTPDFSVSMDLGAFAPGAYALVLAATDGDGLATTVSRWIVVASKQTILPPVAMTLGPNERLLAAEGDLVLFRGSDNQCHLRDLAAGTEAVLQQTRCVDAGRTVQWLIDGRRVFRSGGDSACAPCVFQWASDGSFTSLSSDAPAPNPTYPGPWTTYAVAAHGGYLVWREPLSTRYVVRHLASGAMQFVPVPDGALQLGDDFDFRVVQGVVRLVFSAPTGSTADGEDRDIFAWRSDTAITTRWTWRGHTNFGLKTDGERAAWISWPRPADPGFVAVGVTPADGGPVASLAAMRSDFAPPFLLADGVFAWQEPAAAGGALRVSTTQGGVQTLSTDPGAVLLRAHAGAVVWRAGGTYIQRPPGGAPVRVADIELDAGVAGGGSWYSRFGASVYRIRLAP